LSNFDNVGRGCRYRCECEHSFAHHTNTHTLSGDWANDEVQMELDEDENNKDSINTNQDEQDKEGTGITGGTGDEKDASEYFVVPTKGQSVPQARTQNSKLAIDHILRGSFESTMRLLHDQVGIVCFDEYKQIILQKREAHSRKLFYQVGGLKVARLQTTYRLTTNGKFQETVEKFPSILLSVPLFVVESRQDILESQQLIETCKEYIVGLQISMAK
ncbi:unnamed protein product, partial [Rotaria magnacalcarata]